ncbi:SDR family oxidoreductase [Paraburkholderia sp.]|uniref:SDR family oxidoreductase n=1 Tax=Paraburkholderia sp. TaxID=1926495 RepID=UPI003D6F9A56
MTIRTWFITGINSGFGRSMTEHLLARGDRVAGTARKLEALDDLKARYGEQLWLASLDVTDTPGIRRVVDKAFAELGRIDVVVNNAGYGLFGAAEEISDEQIAHQINTNVIGSIQVVRAALPHLRAQGGGRIVQLSSMGGQIALPGLSLYHATKWAIEGFFEATIQDIAPFNIQVTLVEPGSARTQFSGSSAVAGAALDVYADTPAGQMRRYAAAGQYTPPGDPVKMARAIIASIDQEPAPKRLLLGSDAYALVHAALTERLAALEAQRDLAFSTDFGAPAPSA